MAARAPHSQLLANPSKVMLSSCLRDSELPESSIDFFPAALDEQNRSSVTFWSRAIDSNILTMEGAAIFAVRAYVHEI